VNEDIKFSNFHILISNLISDVSSNVELKAQDLYFGSKQFFVHVGLCS